MKDKRIVYGARCLWWGSIHEVKEITGYGIPGCPHCGSPLFEVDSIETWNAGIEKYSKNDPQYAQFVDWLRTHHRTNFDTARKEFDESQTRQ